jgi:ABC-type sugar transport system substrate-binding protein
MTLTRHALVIVLGAALALPFAAEAQQWPGKGPGPYSPYGAGQYGAGNPYARQLNELAVKDPAKHDACFTQANEKNLRREARWKFMLECMKK